MYQVLNIPMLCLLYGKRPVLEMHNQESILHDMKRIEMDYDLGYTTCESHFL